MQQIIDIVQRLMEELDVTVLGLLCGAFTFILGVIISQYKLVSVRILGHYEFGTLKNS